MSAYYLTSQAAAGIESIWDYIAEDSGVTRADSAIDDIFQAIERLRTCLAWATAGMIWRTRPSSRGPCTPTSSSTEIGTRWRSSTS